MYMIVLVQCDTSIDLRIYTYIYLIDLYFMVQWLYTDEEYLMDDHHT